MKKVLSLLTALVIVFSFCSCDKKETKKEQDDTKKKTEEKISDVYMGTLKAVNETDVIPEGKGQVKECHFEKGDMIKKGQLIYALDDNGISDSIKTTQNSIRKSNLSIQTAQENVNNLKIYAPASGILKNFSIKNGERVNATTIGEIVNEGDVIAVVPFNEQQKSKIALNDRATITSADLMSDCSGYVSRIYSGQTTVDGAVMYNVEITVKNSGGLYNGLSVSAKIKTAFEDVYSPASGVIQMEDGVSIVSKSSGNAVSVSVKSGDYVKKGELLLTLENSNLSSSLSRAKIDKNDLEIKLASLQKDYKDLFIYAPVSGKITELKKKVNDYIASGSESVATISDDSEFTLELNVPEKIYNSLNNNDEIQVEISDIKATKTGTVEKTQSDKKINNDYYTVIIHITNDGELEDGDVANVDFSK